MRCGIYCRLSKEDEGPGREESESIQNQRSLLSQYAADQGWQVEGIYIDEDYSGADPDRPGFQALIRAARAGRVDVVLCKTQSRFTRDMELVERYLHKLFPRWGVRFVAVVDHIDTALQGNKKARQINGLVNEWYLEDLSENIRAVFRQKRLEGRYIGSFAPYGYQKDPACKGRLVVDPQAAAVVRRIFSLYLQGNGTARIAGLLNGEGVPPPKVYREGGQGHWSSTAISRILRGEVYTGNLVQGVKRKESYKSPRLETVPREQWIRVENTHTPIIQQEEFALAQRRLSARTRSDGTGTVHLLAGKVRCMDCGSPMQKLGYRYKGEKRMYLQCKQYANTRKEPLCTGHTIPLEELTGLVQGELARHLTTWYDKGRGEGLLRRQSRKARAPGAGKAALENRLKRLERAGKELYLDKAEGLVGREQYRQLSRELEEEQGQLRRKLKALEEAAGPAAKKEGDFVEKHLRQPGKGLVDLLLEAVEVGERDEETGVRPVRILWRF